jgi:hypothetical protein
MRWIVSLAAAAALVGTFAIAVPTAEAKKKPMNKQCMATNSAGKKVSFSCGAAEKCCWQPVIQKAACVPAPGVCL